MTLTPFHQPLAIFGGTFDPVHNGHLRAAWEAAEALACPVHMIPAQVPPHRPQPAASAEHRLAMLQLALEGQHQLVADARELRREGPSYTVDTLISLREEFGSGRPLILVLGSDAYAGLPKWHRWIELFELAHIAVLTRPGHEMPLAEPLRAETAKRQAPDAGALARHPAGLVLGIEVTPLEISASALRQTLAAGREPRFLLPDAVLGHIRAAGLYRGDPTAS